MPLLPAYYTTTSARKRKSKVNPADLRQDWLEYNKSMKRHGLTMTFEQYVLYRKGKFKPALNGVVKSPLEAESLRTESSKYNSYGNSVGNASAKKENVYTGSYIVGIAVMHKSNSIPITNREQAEEVSRMRRGTMKKIMTFKEFADLAAVARDKNVPDISYYDPTKGWVLALESKKSKKEKSQPATC